MGESVRVVALCVGRAGDGGRGWAAPEVERLLRPSPVGTPAERRHTVGDFWLDADDGRHDLTASIALPGQELPATHPAWVELERCAADFTPGEQMAGALAGLVDAVVAGLAAEAAAEIRSADAIVVITTHGSPLAWSQQVQLTPGEFTPCAHVPRDVTHTTLAHEIGHLLGYEHTFGLSTDRVGAEYGDPYCIMSARRFGGRTTQVTRTLADPELLAGTALWSMVGPGLARATAWARHPEWPAAPSADVHVHDWPAVAHPVRVAHSGVPGRHPRLVAVRSPGRPSHWLTLEVRGPLPEGVAGADWDAAFRLDREPSTGRPVADRDPHDAPGIVVHEVDEAAGVTYRGTIALPLGGDTDLEVGPEHSRLTVRATGYRDGVATVLIGAEPGVPMAWARIEDDGRPVVHAFSTGYAEPAFTWCLDGEELVAGARLGDVVWDRLALPDGRHEELVVTVDVHEAATVRPALEEARTFQVTTFDGARRIEVHCRAW